MENLNGQKANQLAIYNPGLSVEQGTIRKHETHLLIREGLDLGTTHAPLYYSNSLLKPKTFPHWTISGRFLFNQRYAI